MAMYIRKTYAEQITTYEVLGTVQRANHPNPINTIWVRTVSGAGHVGTGRMRTIRESELRISPMWRAVEL